MVINTAQQRLGSAASKRCVQQNRDMFMQQDKGVLNQATVTVQARSLGLTKKGEVDLGEVSEQQEPKELACKHHHALQPKHCATHSNRKGFSATHCERGLCAHKQLTRLSTNTCM